MTRQSVARDLLEAAFSRSERMVGRRIAGEYVLVPIVGRGAEVDSIFTLNRVGAFIWEQLDGKRTGEDVVRALGRRFDVDAARAEQDYCDFVQKLQLIRAIGDGAAR
jgi:hypothetical protein